MSKCNFPVIRLCTDCALLFFLFSCGNNGKSGFALGFLSNGKNPLNIFEVEIDSLESTYPWQDWNIAWFRPESAHLASYLNSENTIIHLTILSFPNEYLPFGVFKRLGFHPAGGGNYYFWKNTLVFYRENYFGLFALPGTEEWNDIQVSEFRSIFNDKRILPKIFDAFPIHGRIPNSENVTPAHFSGLDIAGEAVSVSYSCYFDTMTVYRSFFNPRQRVFQEIAETFSGTIDTVDMNSVKYLQFWGVTDDSVPVLLLGYERGLIRTEGCSDSKIVDEITQKTLKLDILLP